MTHVTLIAPPTCRAINGFNFNKSIKAPLGLAYLCGALLKSNHDIHVIDAVGEAPEQYENYINGNVVRGLNAEQILNKISVETDMIGISLMFAMDWMYVKKIIALIKEKFPDKLLIIGGEQATATYEHILKMTAVDVVALGEGDETIIDLAKNCYTPENLSNVKGIAFKDIHKNIVVTPKRSRILEIDDLAEPAWQFFPMQNYMQYRTGLCSWEKKKIPMLA